jgi:hypothetical protein
MKTEDLKTLTDRHAAIKAECEKLGAEIERLKAGGDEWGDQFKYGDKYWFIDNNGMALRGAWTDHPVDERRKARGNIYRTEQAAREADEQIQFLRRAMTAGDLAPDAEGAGLISRVGKADFLIENPNGWALLSGFRKFSTIEARDAFIKSEGGIEVFRARLAKGWPV